MLLDISYHHTSTRQQQQQRNSIPISLKVTLLMYTIILKNIRCDSDDNSDREFDENEC